ncbi:hypothetical protein V8E53_013609 [Lactarius tabidus]
MMRSAFLTKSRVPIDNFPEDVLLEIFDAYRQDIEPLPRYENIWNSRDGWWKLAHVCPRWRRVVLSSPTRLHVHLLFTPRRSSRVVMLKQLPPFPILVDYRTSSWTQLEEDLALAALRLRSRVRGIALQRPYKDKDKLFRSLSRPFPELESVDISLPWGSGPRVLPAKFLSGSVPCLRRLTVREIVPGCLSPLLSLSFTTRLVELTLTNTGHSSLLEASLLPNLQRMSCLRRLELDLNYRLQPRYFEPDPPAPASAEVVIPLPELTHLIFRGHRLYLQALVVGLIAPSLQHLDVELSGQSERTFPIPHLCKFICNSKCQFTAIRWVFSSPMTKFYAGTSSESIDDESFRIVIPESVSLEKMGQELSEPLSTVEELTITFKEWWSHPGPSKADQLRGFFYHVPQVKTVAARVPSEEALNIARSFQQDGQESAMDILPALEQVKVDMSPYAWREYNRDAFERFIAARQRVGRPIIVSWI